MADRPNRLLWASLKTTNSLRGSHSHAILVAQLWYLVRQLHLACKCKGYGTLDTFFRPPSLYCQSLVPPCAIPTLDTLQGCWSFLTCDHAFNRDHSIHRSNTVRYWRIFFGSHCNSRELFVYCINIGEVFPHSVSWKSLGSQKHHLIMFKIRYYLHYYAECFNISAPSLN